MKTIADRRLEFFFDAFAKGSKKRVAREMLERAYGAVGETLKDNLKWLDEFATRDLASARTRIQTRWEADVFCAMVKIRALAHKNSRLMVETTTSLPRPGWTATTPSVSEDDLEPAQKEIRELLETLRKPGIGQPHPESVNVWVMRDLHGDSTTARLMISPAAWHGGVVAAALYTVLEGPIRFCLACGKPFEVTRPWARFCSPLCNNRKWRKMARENQEKAKRLSDARHGRYQKQVRKQLGAELVDALGGAPVRRRPRKSK